MLILLGKAESASFPVTSTCMDHSFLRWQSGSGGRVALSSLIAILQDALTDFPSPAFLFF